MSEKLQTVERPPEFLNLDSFFQNLKIEEKTVDIPNFGKIQIRPIDLKQRNSLMSACSDAFGKVDNAKFTAMTLHFGMVSPKIPLDRIEQIQTGNPKVIDTISKAIWELSGLVNFETIKNV